MYCGLAECAAPIPAAQLLRFPRSKFCCKTHKDRGHTIEAARRRRAVVEVPRKCKLTSCANTFVRLRGRQAYCSEKCGDTGRRLVKNAGRTCRSCPTEIRDSRKHFCSPECRTAWGIKTGKITVKLCKTPECGLPAVKGCRGFCSRKCILAKRRLRRLAKYDAIAKVKKAEREAEAKNVKCSECQGPVPIARAIQGIGRGWNAFCQSECSRVFWKKKANGKIKKSRPPRPVRPCLYPLCAKPIQQPKRGLRRYCNTQCGTRDRAFAKAGAECEMCEIVIPLAYRRLHPGASTCSQQCRNDKMIFKRRIKAEKSGKGPT